MTSNSSSPELTPESLIAESFGRYSTYDYEDVVTIVKAALARACDVVPADTASRNRRWEDSDDLATADALRKLLRREPSLREVTQIQKACAPRESVSKPVKLQDLTEAERRSILVTAGRRSDGDESPDFYGVCVISATLETVAMRPPARRTIHCGNPTSPDAFLPSRPSVGAARGADVSPISKAQREMAQHNADLFGIGFTVDGACITPSRVQVFRPKACADVDAQRLVEMVLDDMLICRTEPNTNNADYEFKELSSETVEAFDAFRARGASSAA